jgi:hypothetical protein
MSERLMVYNCAYPIAGRVENRRYCRRPARPAPSGPGTGVQLEQGGFPIIAGRSAAQRQAGAKTACSLATSSGERAVTLARWGNRRRVDPAGGRFPNGPASLPTRLRPGR